MPTYLFSLKGRWSACPQTGGLLASGSISDDSPISEQVTCSAKNEGDYPLTSDAPVTVDFGGVGTANVIMIVADRPVTIGLTPVGGSAQAITTDSLRLVSRTKAYEAITLTRSPATLTNVTVFIAQKA